MLDLGCYSMIALSTIVYAFVYWISQDDIELLKSSLLAKKYLSM